MALSKKYKNFNSIVHKVISKSSTQRKKILDLIERQDITYFKRAEEFSSNFFRYIKREKMTLSYAVDAYLKLCFDMFESQKFFFKYKKYPLSKEKDAYKKVYNNIKTMKSYMIGVAISQFLWSTHYAMFSFFIKNINLKKNLVKNYLEIGPGHGLFFLEALKSLNRAKNFDIVDISKTSIKITKSLINFLYKKESNINYYLKNISSFKPKIKYDFVTFGEVLEHVNNPKALLKKINAILSNNGYVYISTCVD
jgi:2-polyprenyl-3-methyl-5-hydroxy-6-metoxy-1,4-benzoquinol methylase